MKINNHYIWLCVLWLLSSVMNSICAVTNFVDGSSGIGILFLVTSVGFAFVGGILLERALQTHKHNQEVELLHYIMEELMKEEAENIKPFEEF